MNIQAFLKHLLLVIFLYSSSTSCAPLIALLCGAAAPGIATGAVAGAAIANKESELKLAHVQAIARNEQQALAAGNAQLLQINAKLTAQCEAMKKETEQLNERRSQLTQGLSLMSDALTQERNNRVALEELNTHMNQQLERQQVRNNILQRSADFHRTLSRGSLGVVCLGACIGYWGYQRAATRKRTKLEITSDQIPPISPTGHRIEIPDISRHHQQTGDQSHQMRLRYDG